jgi:hypothetical protein
MSDTENSQQRMDREMRLISEAKCAGNDLQSALESLGDALDKLQRDHDNDEARDLFREVEHDFCGPVEDLAYRVNNLEIEAEQ